METKAFTRRRLFIALVVAAVIIVLTLVWLVATRLPRNRLGLEKPTTTYAMWLARNCTYPRAYWEAHPELYPTQVILGGVIYRERELEALLSDDSQELAQQIKSQLAVAFLNGLAGADQSSIQTTVFEAYGWLIKNPAGSPETGETLQSGIQLFNILQAYNLGLLGVEPCEMISGAAPTGTATGVITEGASQTLTQTITITTSVSPTPTASQFRASATVTVTNKYIIPTREATQTSRPPVQHPTNTSTNTPKPSPTNTPIPDTPTFTPQPTATFAPTLPPTDTPVPTLPPKETAAPTLPGPLQ